MQSAQFQLHAQIEERHWWFVARRRILSQLVRQIAPPAADRQSILIDIGCGTGANLAAFANDYRCIGIDTATEAIRLASSRFPRATFVCGFAPRDVGRWLKLASVVLITDVLEHVADDRGLLESIVAATAPEAQIVLTVPADMRLWSPHDEAFGHFRRYDRESFSNLWTGLPVQQRLLSHFNTRLYPIVRLVRGLNNWRGRAAGAANTDFKLPASPINRLLEAIFAGESRRLQNGVDGGTPGYSRGVSLIAILERLSSSPSAPSKCVQNSADPAASIPLAAADL